MLSTQLHRYLQDKNNVYGGKGWRIEVRHEIGDLYSKWAQSPLKGPKIGYGAISRRSPTCGALSVQVHKPQRGQKSTMESTHNSYAYPHHLTASLLIRRGRLWERLRNEVHLISRVQHFSASSSCVVMVMVRLVVSCNVFLACVSAFPRLCCSISNLRICSLIARPTFLPHFTLHTSSKLHQWVVIIHSSFLIEVVWLKLNCINIVFHNFRSRSKMKPKPWKVVVSSYVRDPISSCN